MMTTRHDVERRRVLVIGAGFAGIGLGARLRQDGVDDFLILERGADVGGTWRDNRYPGCQCDVPSHLYSFSFAPNPDWSRTYSPQPEILDYLRDCADRFGVRPHIRFGHTVTSAEWDTDHWRVETDQGTFEAAVLVSAHGGLSEPAIPALPGLDAFEGEYFHSATWPEPARADAALKGRNVVVVGTGASAVQLIPHLQREAAHLTVSQRTPAWVLPHTDRPVRGWERRLYRRVPAVQRLIRGGIYSARELLVIGMAKRPRLLRPIKRLATEHLHRSVQEPELRATLTPSFEPGCKRLLLSDDYYPALTADNVEVVASALVEVAPNEVITADGVKHDADTIVFATGFRVTDSPIAARIRGRDGRSLADVWAETGPTAYLGTTVSGFPNLFLLSGPNTGIGHTSLVYMIESQLPYVLGALRHLEETGAAGVDVRADVVEAWDRRLQAKLAPTVWNSGGCSSWYLHASGRNATLWPDFTFRFRRLTRRFDAERYEVLPRTSPSLAPTGRDDMDDKVEATV
jgi:cation diffusion facilitator CzcD-associated flavoprotein CzcO